MGGPHHGRAGTGLRLKAGMVFTIEPMINLGDYEVEILAIAANVPSPERHALHKLLVYGERAGVVEVGYLEERPARDEGPFLKEERDLIDAIRHYDDFDASVEDCVYTAAFSARRR